MEDLLTQYNKTLMDKASADQLKYMEERIAMYKNAIKHCKFMIELYRSVPRSKSILINIRDLQIEIERFDREIELLKQRVNAIYKEANK